MKLTKWKTVKTALLSMALAASLTACGSGSTGKTAETTAQDAETTAESVETAETASEKAEETTAAEASAAETTKTEGEAGTSDGAKTAVVYFSATGHTDHVAQVIAEATGAEVLQLEPQEPYTTADLNYNDSSSRVSKEHDDESLRDIPLVTDTLDDWDSIETVYLGYPIWWGIAAWPVDTFVKANDFTGKTVIPFCTSASSNIGSSDKQLAEMAGTGDWLEGKRFSSSASEGEVKSWVESLNLN